MCLNLLLDSQKFLFLFLLALLKCRPFTSLSFVPLCKPPLPPLLPFLYFSLCSSSLITFIFLFFLFTYLFSKPPTSTFIVIFSFLLALFHPPLISFSPHFDDALFISLPLLLFIPPPLHVHQPSSASSFLLYFCRSPVITFSSVSISLFLLFFILHPPIYLFLICSSHFLFIFMFQFFLFHSVLPSYSPFCSFSSKSFLSLVSSSLFFIPSALFFPSSISLYFTITGAPADSFYISPQRGKNLGKNLCQQKIYKTWKIKRRRFSLLCLCSGVLSVLTIVHYFYQGTDTPSHTYTRIPEAC